MISLRNIQKKEPDSGSCIGFSELMLRVEINKPYIHLLRESGKNFQVTAFSTCVDKGILGEKEFQLKRIRGLPKRRKGTKENYKSLNRSLEIETSEPLKFIKTMIFEKRLKGPLF